METAQLTRVDAKKAIAIETAKLQTAHSASDQGAVGCELVCLRRL